MRKMRWMTIVGALIISSTARADPVLLVCEGETRRYAGDEVTKEYLSLAIDMRAGTATVEGYRPLSLSVREGFDEVGFWPKSGSGEGKNVKGDQLIEAGEINRMTGIAWINFEMQNRLYKFQGMCRSAQRLF
jgi:hypothetical protein